jgi:hypothetical protein
LSHSRKEMPRDISKTIIRHSLPRDVLDDDDIGKILQFPQYALDADVPSSHFWVIMISLFSGASAGEICCLEVDDFCVADDIHCFIIHTRENRQLKLSWTDRLVPIHPFLLNDLNIIGFISNLKQSGEKRLFPELKADTRGWCGNSISKMFVRLAKEYKVESRYGWRKTFTSIRHTVIKKLKSLGVDESLIFQLVGRKDPRSNILPSRDVPKPYPLRNIYEVVTKISYNVDFSVLNTSHFIIR